MVNIGTGEVLFIAVVALLLFGPRRLPEISRSLGKALAEFRRATNELRDGFTAGFEDLREPLFLTGPAKATMLPPRPPALGAAPEPAGPPEPAGGDTTP